MDRQVIGLLCRTSDRGRGVAEGTRELAELLDARIVGSPGEPRDGSWEEDRRSGRGCLLEAGGQIDDALAAGRVPILLAGECSVAVCTLPVRDLDGAERVALDRSGVHRVEDAAQLEGLELLVHLDLDVLDPLAFPASFPAPGGLSPAGLHDVLEQATAAATLVGAEITSAAPGHGELVADAIAPLLA